MEGITLLEKVLRDRAEMESFLYELHDRCSAEGRRIIERAVKSAALLALESSEQAQSNPAPIADRR